MYELFKGLFNQCFISTSECDERVGSWKFRPRALIKGAFFPRVYFKLYRASPFIRIKKFGLRARTRWKIVARGGL